MSDIKLLLKERRWGAKEGISTEATVSNLCQDTSSAKREDWFNRPQDALQRQWTESVSTEQWHARLTVSL